MMPRYPANSTSRRRWILAYPLLNVALLFGLGVRPLPWLEIGVLSMLFVLFVVAEFVLMPRMSLPPSRWCSRCDARSPEKSRECVGCGREFLSDKPVLYPIDASMLAATKKAGWFAVAIMAGMTIPVFLLWFAFPRFGGQMVVMTVLFFMMFYGHEIARWVVLRRIVRQLRHHEGAVCTRCVYPIGESMVMCPECGKVENAERARRDWLATGLWLPDSLVTPASAATSSPANP